MYITIFVQLNAANGDAQPICLTMILRVSKINHMVKHFRQMGCARPFAAVLYCVLQKDVLTSHRECDGVGNKAILVVKYGIPIRGGRWDETTPHFRS